jgi:hypothetical protein
MNYCSPFKHEEEYDTFLLIYDAIVELFLNRYGKMGNHSNPSVPPLSICF